MREEGESEEDDGNDAKSEGWSVTIVPWLSSDIEVEVSCLPIDDESGIIWSSRIWKVGVDVSE